MKVSIFVGISEIITCDLWPQPQTVIVMSSPDTRAASMSIFLTSHYYVYTVFRPLFVFHVAAFGIGFR